MKRKWKIFTLFVLFIVCISIDLGTKDMAQRYLKYSAAVQIVPDYIEFRYTENDAIAFSMLKNIPKPRRTIIIYSTTIFAFIVLGLLAYQSREESYAWKTAIVFIATGAIGNFVDRLFDGHVVDFIHFHYQDKFSWPIFNVADILITCGAILLALLMLTRKDIPDEDLQLSDVKRDDPEIF